MESDKKLIKASFEIIGETQSITFRSAFDVTKNPIVPIKKTEGIQTFGKTGRIYTGGYGGQLIPNAKVVALKNGIVYDFDTTNEFGEYTLLLEEGIYDIRIEAHGYQRTMKNYYHKKEDSIVPYRNVIVDGQIKKQLFDVIEFSDFDPKTGRELIDKGTRLVSGTVIGEQGQPIEGAEIVVAESDTHRVETFVKTGKDGKYVFTIERENYDIIIRSPIHHAKKLENYLFISDKGFMPQVLESALMFRKGGEWIWISN